MAKKPNAPLCARCETPFRDVSPFCAACGGPTPWASHDERVAWEVRQWRASRATTEADKPQMMLVRTEAGYEPMAVARYNEYVWDQPLHPEREQEHPTQPVRPQPLEVTANSGNGHQAPAAPVEAPTHGVEPDEPVAEADDPEPEASIRPNQAEQTAILAQDGDRVTISRKAVAIGIALVLGLPLGTKLLGSLGGTPATSGRPAAGAAAAKPVALLAAHSGFQQLTPDAVRYAVVVENTNKAYHASGVSVSVSVHDAGGRLIGAGSERVAVVPASGATGVAGMIGVSGPAARITVRIGTSLFEDSSSGQSFRVRGVRISGDASRVSVQASVSGVAPADGARVVAVYLDRSGRVIGGDFTYVNVPVVPRSVPVVITTSGLPRKVARALIYVLEPR